MKKHRHGWRCVLLACLIFPIALTATASWQITVGPGLRADRPARSLRDLRDQNLVRQQFDFSCGAASLATLLRYGFGDDVTETQLLDEMFDSLPEAEQAIRQAEGFSLLDLQRVAGSRGYRAEGYRLSPEQVTMLAGPVIVFVEPRGYEHFAVLRGVRGGRAYLADPSRGNLRMPLYRFLDEWVQDDGRGIAFVVEPESGLPAEAMPLGLDSAPGMPPEIMTAREMMTIGNPLARLPEPTR